MNRHDRRKQQAQERGRVCMSCGRVRWPLFKSEDDGKLRCTACHPMHVQHAAKPSDDMIDPKHIKAQQLQEGLFRAIGLVCKDTFADAGLIIQCLGITAATFAVQQELDEPAFTRAMSMYMKQVQGALGMNEPAAADEPAPEAPPS